MSVTFRDNSPAVRYAMARAKVRALTEIGLIAVEVTTDYMQSRYGAPIRQTGDLMRDVNSRVQIAESKVAIGNSLNYALPVHNGTSKTSGRPYLFDAATENTDIWKEITEDHIGEEIR